jgi:hypothetical protein
MADSSKHQRLSSAGVCIAEYLWHKLFEGNKALTLQDEHVAGYGSYAWTST